MSSTNSEEVRIGGVATCKLNELLCAERILVPERYWSEKCCLGTGTTKVISRVRERFTASNLHLLVETYWGGGGHSRKLRKHLL